MRNLSTILKSLSFGLAVAVVGCEENTPPQPPKVSVTEVKLVDPPAPVTPPVVAEAKLADALPPAPTVNDAPDVDPDDLTPSEAIDYARKALGKGDLDEALVFAQVAVDKSPKRSAAWNTLGRVQLQRGERKRAIETLAKAVELNPTSSFAQNNLGLAHLYAGHYEDAVHALDQATHLEPVKPYMWNNLGMALEHLDRLDEARHAYGQAVALGKSTGARRNLARLEGVKTVHLAKNDVGGRGTDAVEVDEHAEHMDVMDQEGDMPPVAVDGGDGGVK